MQDAKCVTSILHPAFSILHLKIVCVLHRLFLRIPGSACIAPIGVCNNFFFLLLFHGNTSHVTFPKTQPNIQKQGEVRSFTLFCSYFISILITASTAHMAGYRP